MSLPAVDEAFLALDRWICENGWAGYDPYDIRGQAWFTRLFGRQNLLFRKIRGVLAVAEKNVPPLLLRRLLRVEKQINPKGMGLLASAYLARYGGSGEASFLNKAEDVLAWLAANQSPGYPGACWGYPFDWQSRILIPRGTPSVVVTGTVGGAWMDHYELTGSPESLEMVERVATFFMRALNRPVDQDDRLCFSYTPIDWFKVLNANLFAAALLARAAAATGNAEYRDAALKAVRYTLAEQNPDGSFYYWGSEPPTPIDHYHSGFVLRHLDTVRRALSAEFIEGRLRLGHTFYLERLFTPEGIPMFTPDSLYPIDIHSCAEALLCLSQLGPDFGGLEKLAPLFAFIEMRMKDRAGWYIAGVRKTRRGEARIEVPYMRWAQAWMLLGLARLRNRLCESG